MESSTVSSGSTTPSALVPVSRPVADGTTVQSERAALAAARAQLEALQNAATAILSVRDLDQVLLSITNRILQLLDADISGLFLVEGDELVMRSCVGHRVVQTERLRMRRGQGLAGRVFLTGEPCKVDSYLEDDKISRDFTALAVQEGCSSALGVPLVIGGDMIGVLEVWRRRSSVFTTDDVQRLVGLANLATIAIDNARLYERQARSVAALAQARNDLEQQVDLLRRSARLQRALLETLLAGDGLHALVRTVALEVGCGAMVLSSAGDVLAAYPVEEPAAAVQRVVGPVTPHAPKTATVALGERTVWTQQVWAGHDLLGVVCLIADELSPELLDIARGQAALACALHHMEERAASRARATARDEILWDLLQGPPAHRVAALSRAERMHLDLSGSHRVVHGLIENVEDLARGEGWDTSKTNGARRAIAQIAQRVVERSANQIVSVRGDLVVAVVHADLPHAKRVVMDLQSEIASEFTALRSIWGVSAAHDSPLDFHVGYSEARTALTAAQRLGAARVQVFDELGVVRLLLGPGGSNDLQQFVADVLGPLMEYDRERDGELITTLRAYFEADCSQKDAAQRLFIHHKTMRYRLARISELTGLDLRRHEDRMRADLALRIHQVELSHPPAAPADGHR